MVEIAASTFTVLSYVSRLFYFTRHIVFGLPKTICFSVLFWSVFGLLLLWVPGWHPGFPRAWYAWVAFLITLPAFSFLQLSWLLWSAWISSGRNGRGKGTGIQSELYALLANDHRREFRASDRWTQSSSERLRRPSFTVSWYAQCFIYTIITLVGLYQCIYYEYEGDLRFRSRFQEALADPNRRPSGYGSREQIFIAAAFHQNEPVLPYWTRSILDAIVYLGSDNVYVSVVENYSTDRSPVILRSFARELDRRGVRNRILVQDERAQEPLDRQGNARIEFLATIRNQVLEPLREGGEYDKVLFSNDVYIEPESILELLDTRGGDYDFACGMDFGRFGAYDMWVLRDRLGRLTSSIWPYFFDTAGYEATKAEEPVPVFTCWNGIVAFSADPLLPIHLRSNRTLSTSPLPSPPPAKHPLAHQVAASPEFTPPLTFRASAEGECYSSESFLLPYDFRRIMGLEKIYVNPRVVTAYWYKYYVWHKWVMRHRYVKWFVERVWDGAGMQYRRIVLGDAKEVRTWDGVDCHPWT